MGPQGHSHLLPHGAVSISIGVSSHHLLSFYSHHIIGIAWQDYPQVRDQRSFALKTLKDRGMGKCELEPLIQEEIQELLQKIGENETQPFDFAPFIHRAVTNVIASIVFGQRYDYDDEEFISLIDAVKTNLELNVKINLTGNIPLITWLPFDVSGHNKVLRNYGNLRNFMKKAMQEHKRKLDRENPIDFIDQYLVRIEEERGNPEKLFTGKLLHT